MDTINQNNSQTKKSILIKRVSIFVGIILILLIGYFIYWFFIGSKYEETDDSYINGYQNQVVSQVNGNIEKVFIDDSQNLKKGELTVSLDKTDYQIALNQAQADLEKSVRNYFNLKSSTSQSEENFKSKNSDFQKATIDFQRDTLSYKKGLMSKVDFENSQYHLQQTKIAIDNAQEALLNAKTQSLTESIYKHPDVFKAIQEYKSAYVNLQRTQIVSPIDGIVAKKTVNAGQRVNPNQPLFTLVDIHHEWVDANFKEDQLKNLKVGQVVALNSDVNDKTYEGYVGGIEAGSGSAFSLLPAQNATGNWIKIVQRVPVKIFFDEDSLQKNGVLPLGTSVRVSVRLDNMKKNLPPAYNQNTDIFNIDNADLDKKINQIIMENLPK